MEKPNPAYFEIIDFIAAGATSQQVADYHPSEQAQNRVSALLEKMRSSELDEAEQSELDQFMALEHTLRMAKARARQLLANAG